DETLEPGLVADAVAELALRKARTVAERVGVGVVLAADTVVGIDGVLLGKPAGVAEGRGMLVRLRGREEKGVTGIWVMDAGGGRRRRARSAGYSWRRIRTRRSRPTWRPVRRSTRLGATRSRTWTEGWSTASSARTPTWSGSRWRRLAACWPPLASSASGGLDL